MSTLTETTRRRLDIQGFERVEDRALAEVAPWLRLAFGLCAVMAGVGTAMASPIILLLLVPIAGLAALFPIHPFDLIYNFGIRFITKTAPLPRRDGAPRRGRGPGQHHRCVHPVSRISVCLWVSTPAPGRAGG